MGSASLDDCFPTLELASPRPSHTEVVPAMKKSPALCLATLFSMVCLSATAETVTPLQGQSPQTIQQDIGACQAQAGSTNGTGTASQPGERARGAATGAVAGAAAANARARQHEEVYDRIDEDVQQEYRQDRAKQGAVAGAAVSGSRQRQERRQERRNADQNAGAASSAYIDCMQQRGYQVTP